MFSGGELASGPASSGKGSVACKASDGLLVDAVAALKAIMKPCKRKGRRLCGEECAVHVQCGVLDKEEMLGYTFWPTPSGCRCFARRWAR